MPPERQVLLRKEASVEPGHSQYSKETLLSQSQASGLPKSIVYQRTLSSIENFGSKTSSSSCFAFGGNEALCSVGRSRILETLGVLAKLKLLLSFFGPPL